MRSLTRLTFEHHLKADFFLVIEYFSPLCPGLLRCVPSWSNVSRAGPMCPVLVICVPSRSDESRTSDMCPGLVRCVPSWFAVSRACPMCAELVLLVKALLRISGSPIVSYQCFRFLDRSCVSGSPTVSVFPVPYNVSGFYCAVESLCFWQLNNQPHISQAYGLTEMLLELLDNKCYTIFKDSNILINKLNNNIRNKV